MGWTLAAVAAFGVVTYAVDVASLAFGPLKVPLALVLLSTAYVFLTYEVLLTRSAPGSVVRGGLLWLLIFAAWLLATMYGDQAVTDADLRLLVYSLAALPMVWLARGPLRDHVAAGMLVGVLLAVAIGYFRFFTASGGAPSEHALGYWGIKYLPSTRNGDVLYPLIGVALSLHYLHQARTRGRRVLAAMAILLFALAIILSSSRGAWLTLAALVLVDAFRTSRRSFTRLAVTGITVAALLGSITQVAPDLGTLLSDRASTLFTLDSSSGGSNFERLALLSAATDASSSSVLGAGIGSFGARVGFTNVVGDAVNHAENLLLTVAVEQGLLGLLVYAALTVMLAARALQGGITGNVAIVALGHSLLNYELNSLFYWAMLFYGLAISVYGHPSSAQRRHTPTPGAGLSPLPG